MISLVSRDEYAQVRVTLLIVALCAAVYYPTWAALTSRWYDLSETDAHGFLIVATSVFLLLRYSAESDVAASRRIGGIALLGLIACTLVWLLGYFSNVLLVQALILPVILLFTFIAVFGYAGSRRLFFPILFLYFSVPVWGFLKGPLQEATISVVSWFLSSARIPALIEGELVHVPSGSFRIESGCAGLHFVVVALALSVLYAHLCFKRVRSWILFMAVAAAFAVVVNWIRVATVIVAGHKSEMQHYLVTVDHYYFGWLLFLLMLIPLYYIAGWIERGELGIDVRAPQRSGEAEPRKNKGLPGWWPVLFGLCAFPVIGYALDGISATRPDSSLRVSDSLGSWVWLEGVPPNWTPQFPGAQIELCGEYRRESDDIHFYANLYTNQSQGEELIGGMSKLMDPASARVLSQSIVNLVTDDGNQTPFIQTRAIHRSGVQQIALSWYQVGQRPYVREIDVKLNELLARSRGGSGSGVVAVKMDCESDCVEESELLNTFVTVNAAEIVAKSFSEL